MAKKAYVGVPTVTKATTPLGEKTVGEEVKLKVNGVPRSFIVVHQGNPDASIYDSSCDGTWLLMKEIYETRAWNPTDEFGINDYANSDIYAYLNGGFLSLFDSGIQSIIKQVKIPYRAGSGYSATITSGANGLSTKVFLLSGTETSFNWSGVIPVGEGAELSYFSGCADREADNKRIAYLNGTVDKWWLRTPYCDSGGGDWSVFRVYSDGSCDDNVG